VVDLCGGGRWRIGDRAVDGGLAGYPGGDGESGGEFEIGVTGHAKAIMHLDKV
jgi:hypothetical protein